jgi:hypothetical protein
MASETRRKLVESAWGTLSACPWMALPENAALHDAVLTAAEALDEKFSTAGMTVYRSLLNDVVNRGPKDPTPAFDPIDHLLTRGG